MNHSQQPEPSFGKRTELIYTPNISTTCGVASVSRGAASVSCGAANVSRGAASVSCGAASASGGAACVRHGADVVVLSVSSSVHSL